MDGIKMMKPGKRTLIGNEADNPIWVPTGPLE